jgi:hypothetical protein
MDFDQLLSSASEKVDFIAPAFSFGPHLFDKIFAIEDTFEIRDQNGNKRGYSKVQMLIKAHSDHAFIVFCAWDLRGDGNYSKGGCSYMELIGILDKMLKSTLYASDPYCMYTQGIKVQVLQDVHDSIGELEASHLFKEFKREARVLRLCFLEEGGRLAFGFFEGKPFEALMAYLDEKVSERGGVQW